MEEILKPTTGRFTTFPIRYPDLWALYKKAVGSFWTAEEIDLAGDLKDWDTLKPDEQHFMCRACFREHQEQKKRQQEARTRAARRCRCDRLTRSGVRRCRSGTSCAWQR
jgi:hypothetical protein